MNARPRVGGEMKSPIRLKPDKEAKCWGRGFHDYKEYIDPQSGGFIKCKDCGKTVDCEDPDGDLG